MAIRLMAPLAFGYKILQNIVNQVQNRVGFCVDRIRPLTKVFWKYSEFFDLSYKILQTE